MRCLVDTLFYSCPNALDQWAEVQALWGHIFLGQYAARLSSSHIWVLFAVWTGLYPVVSFWIVPLHPWLDFFEHNF